MPRNFERSHETGLSAAPQTTLETLDTVDAVDSGVTVPDSPRLPHSPHGREALQIAFPASQKLDLNPPQLVCYVLSTR